MQSPYLENEVDGEGFLLLTDEDISEMVKPLGARRKLITKKTMLTRVSTCMSCCMFVAIFGNVIIIISVYILMQSKEDRDVVHPTKEFLHEDKISNSDNNSEKSIVLSDSEDSEVTEYTSDQLYIYFPISQ